MDEVNPKVSVFRDFNEKSLSGGSYAHIINETPNLFKPRKLWAIEASSRYKKTGESNTGLNKWWWDIDELLTEIISYYEEFQYQLKEFI